MVPWLLDNGLDISARERSYGYTPLHWGACYGYVEVSRVLVGKGADVNAEASYGETPLSLCKGRANTGVEGQDYPEVVALLTAAGATE
jgi:ankyrin repeat protein